MSGEAFWRGYDARLRGAATDTCPYVANSEKHFAWLEGYAEELFDVPGGDAARP